MLRCAAGQGELLRDLTVRCEALKAKQRAEHEKRDPQPESVVQLPLWPELVRAVPNGFLRSALFGLLDKKKKRSYIKREQIAALDGLEIFYTGERLDQGDLDVYESVLHVMRHQVMGEQCRVTSSNLLRLLGRTDSGNNHALLQMQLTRLRAGAVEIKQGRYTYIGGLIDEAFRDEKTKEWVIVLNPKLRALFAHDQFSQIEWAVRFALRGKQLAQWLHGFYASHAKPYPLKIETLRRLCGSEAKRMDHFQEMLRMALDAVLEASKANGEGFNYVIRGDLVFVEKKAKGAQRRHLARKSAKPRKPRI